MKLHYYQPNSNQINFGDQLNVDLWEYFFPNYFDNDVSTVFFGIGTILRAAQKKYPNSLIVIFGSGSHKNKFQLINKTKIYFVRGPLTAKSLNICSSYAITDPALLIDEVYTFKNKRNLFKFGYMPHFSVDSDAYRIAVEKAGLLYISPNQQPKIVIEQLHKCEVIITEAMHGAIVSDTYNIPWIPVYTYQSFNHFKWEDWTKSLNLKVKFFKLPRLYYANGIKYHLKREWFIYKLKQVMKQKAYLSDFVLRRNLKIELIKQINQFKKDYDILN